VRVALDATYSVAAQPSGIAVYSRRILDGLASQFPADQFLHCYRPKQYRRSPAEGAKNVRRRILLPWFGTGLRADVFHALNQRVDRRQGRRVVSTFHDLFVMTGEYSSPEFRKRFSAQAREAAQRSDLIIAVSQFTADQVSELLRVEQGRIRVIPHGVDTFLQTPTQPRELLVLFVGALQARKNVSRLVEAFETMPTDWRLVLAGAPSGYQAGQILARIEASPARTRIEVAGYVSKAQLESLLARASIFAFPSLDEGFGIPVLEAMAWGVPVITSNSSALREVAGSAALLVNPMSTDEIAQALKRLAYEKDSRHELIQKGMARAAQFTWVRAVERTYEVYRELAGA
jgi:glycosyltransferase involved in cell wall biosynthesis